MRSLLCLNPALADEHPVALLALVSMLGHEREALHLAEVFTDPRRKVRALVWIGVILSQQGRLSELQNLVDQAVEIVGLVDGRAQVDVVAAAARPLIATEHLRSAEAVAQERARVIAVARHLLDPYDCLYACLEIATLHEQTQQPAASTALLEVAAAHARQIGSEQTRATALARVSERLSAAGQVEAAVRLGQEALDIARHLPLRARRGQVLQQIAQAVGLAGQAPLALQVLQEALEPIWQGLARQEGDEAQRAWGLAKVVEVQAGVARNLALAHQTTAAFPLFQETLALVPRITVKERRNEALARLGDALAKAHQVEVALAVARQITNPQDREGVLVEIAATLTSERQFARAIALAWQLPEGWRQSLVLQRVVSTLIDAGQITAATTLAQQIADGQRRGAALTGVALVLVERGQFAAASGLLRQITHLRTRGWALARVGVALAAAGQLTAAAELAQKAIEAVGLLAEVPPQRVPGSGMVFGPGPDRPGIAENEERTSR
jgi:tetratricopeptide (TPR) repeat protein